VFRQPEQRRRRPVRSQQQQQLLWRSAELLCSRPDVCRPGRVCPDLCRPGGLCPGLCRSRGLCPDLCRSGRLCSGLCRSGPDLLPAERLLRQSQEAALLDERLDEQAPLEPEEQQLLQRRPELRLCRPDLRRPVRSELCGSRRGLLPLS